MTNEQKNVIKTVDSLSELEKKAYFSKNEALELLKKEDVTKSEAVLLGWCRDGKLEAVKVWKGHPKDRGTFIKKDSLNKFIHFNKSSKDDLLKEIDRLKEELSAAKQEIKDMKAAGYVKPKLPSIKKFFSIGDGVYSFEYDRAKHRATVEDGKITKLERNSRKGYTEQDNVDNKLEIALNKEIERLNKEEK